MCGARCSPSRPRCRPAARAPPAALQEARTAPHRRRRRLLVFGGLGLATVVGGAVAFSIVRRSMQPEPSALPPSVEVAPKP
nr:cell wall synthesis protein CwsA [Mycobacterium sp. M26]